LLLPVACRSVSRLPTGSGPNDRAKSPPSRKSRVATSVHGVWYPSGWHLRGTTLFRRNRLLNQNVREGGQVSYPSRALVTPPAQFFSKIFENWPPSSSRLPGSQTGRFRYRDYSKPDRASTRRDRKSVV